MKDKVSEIKKIVLCRLGGIGDVIQTLPLVQFLKTKYTEASIEYITSENVAELLISHCPYINKVWVLNKLNKNNLLKTDFFFNLHTTPKFYFYNLFYVRAKRFFQYRKNIKEHVVVNFAKTYDSNISSLDSKTLFQNGDSDILSGHGLKEKRYICFVPGVGKFRQHRAWPLKHWIQLTKQFLNCEKDFLVTYLGGEDEHELIEQLPLDSRIINLIGKLSLPEAANIISNAQCLVSCDTGLLHIGAALSQKVIGLYGPTLSERTSPFTNDYFVFSAEDCKCIESKSCKKISGLTDNSSGYCMNDISTWDVLSKVQEILKVKGQGVSCKPKYL